MALQLSLDGSVKLVGRDDESIRQVLAMTADKYRQFASAVDVGESDKATYWRIQFAILSVHSPIEATFSAYRALRVWSLRFGRVPSERKLQTMLLLAKGEDGTVTQYCGQKAKYIVQFAKDWREDSTRFTRNGDTDAEWRSRVQKNVLGLGLAKASFAVALANPATSDVCCVDTHIAQLFTGSVPKSSIRPKVYAEIEAKIRAFGAEFGLSTFATQWCLWDAKRGVANSHAVLATI